MTLTVAYMSARKTPNIHWFSESLHRECGGDYTGIRIVFVDFYRHTRIPIMRGNGGTASYCPDFQHVEPKPSVWQGPYKLTKDDWFAAAGARNTALCLATDGYIAYVDDLSVLVQGWLTFVREAMARGTVTAFAYQKVRDLVVDEYGDIVSFTEFPQGVDNRYAGGSDSGPVACHGGWLYGSSLVAPVEAFLDVNGWNETCDSLGSEDYIAGIQLEKKGWAIEYDRRGMTIESEELHHVGPVMKRSDYGVSPNDKSHAVLNMALQGDGWHPGYFGEEGIRGLRQRVLAGEPFPIVQVPQHEFFTGKLLSEL